MNPSDPKAQKPVGAILSWLSAHSLLAILIIGIVSTAIIGLADNALSAWLSTPISFADILLWGFVFCVGLVLGYLVNRAWPMRAASWIWILGLGWMIFGMQDARSYDPRWHAGCSAAQFVVNAFFIGSHKCGEGEDALYSLFFTMPALGLAGCSLGAWVALRSARRDKDVVPPVHLA